MLGKNKSAAAVRVITAALKEEGEAEERASSGRWDSSSGRFLREVTRSEVGQDRWNNIIRSPREEERGQIIRLSTAE